MSSSASSASPSGLPDGISRPLETITSTDQGGLIAILGGFALCLVLVSVPIRTYVRSKVGRYKMDDYAFVGSSIFAVLQASVVFYELREGLGKSKELVDPNRVVPLKKAAYASDILYIVTMFLSKCATAFLFLRLTPRTAHAIAIWGTISASIVWAIVSIFLLAFRCHPAHPWTDFSSECTGLFARWEFIGALDIITEAALFFMSVYLIWGIQMAMKSKAIVVCAFGCRLPVIALATLRLHYLQIAINSSNLPLLISNAVSCTQLEIGYSIMASIIPCLKTFMMPYDRAVDRPSQYHNHAHGTSGSHKLSSLGSAARDEGNILDQEPSEQRGSLYMGKLRPEQIVYDVRVSGQPLVETKSVDSGSSQRMIIKKGVEWSVDFDGRNASPTSNLEEFETIEVAGAHAR